MKISERVQVKEAITPQDIATADVTSAYYDLQGIGQVMVVITTGTIAETKKVTVQLMQAKDDQGTDAKTLGDAVELVAGNGGEKLFITTEANAASLDLANGFSHIAVKVGSDDPAATPPDGAAVLIFGDLSFRG
jgi:citrate lyase synthetase